SGECRIPNVAPIAAKDGLETKHTPVSSPFRRLARLEDKSLDRHRDKFRLAFSLSKRPRKRRVQMLDQRSKPRHSEPEQRGCLKGHTDSKRQLIGDCRIVTVLR